MRNPAALGCVISLAIIAAAMLMPNSVGVASDSRTGGITVGSMSSYQDIKSECQDEERCDECGTFNYGGVDVYGYCSKTWSIYPCMDVEEVSSCLPVEMVDCGFWIICDPGGCPDSCVSYPDQPCDKWSCITAP